MHNFFTVFQFELVRTLKKPLFWIGVLAVPALIGILIGAMYFSTKSTQDFEKKQEEAVLQQKVLAMDDSGLVTPALAQQFNVTLVRDKAAAIEQVKSGDATAFYYYPERLAEEKIKVYNRSEGIMENGKYNASAKALIGAAAQMTVASDDVRAALQNAVGTEQKSYENGQEVNLIGRAIVPGLFLVVFYAVIVLLSNQMLTSTTEEKENRVTEMLLTSVSSRTLIVAKIVSLIALGFVQILLILTPVLVAYVFARDALGIPDLASFVDGIVFAWEPLLFGLAFLAFGFLLFTGLLVGISAIAPTAKEANNFFGFVILAIMIPFYFFTMIMSQPESTVTRVLSYFPLTAPVTLMVRNAVGNISTAEGLGGLAILAVSALVVLSVAVRIFRYGTLEYANVVSLRSLLRR